MGEHSKPACKTPTAHAQSRAEEEGSRYAAWTNYPGQAQYGYWYMGHQQKYTTATTPTTTDVCQQPAAACAEIDGSRSSNAGASSMELPTDQSRPPVGAQAWPPHHAILSASDHAAAHAATASGQHADCWIARAELNAANEYAAAVAACFDGSTLSSTTVDDSGGGKCLAPGAR